MLNPKVVNALQLLNVIWTKQGDMDGPYVTDVSGAGLSRSTVSILMHSLKSIDLLDTRRGSNGGVRLARHPSAVLVVDVICAVLPRGRVVTGVNLYDRTMSEWFLPRTLQDLFDEQSSGQRDWIGEITG